MRISVVVSGGRWPGNDQYRYAAAHADLIRAELRMRYPRATITVIPGTDDIVEAIADVTAAEVRAVVEMTAARLGEVR